MSIINWKSKNCIWKSCLNLEINKVIESQLIDEFREELWVIDRLRDFLFFNENGIVKSIESSLDSNQDDQISKTSRPKVKYLI